MDRQAQRAHNATRLAALTRAAYAAGEGVLPEAGAEPADAAAGRVEDPPEEIALDGFTRRAGQVRRVRRQRWWVGLTPRAAIGLGLAVALVLVVLAVRSLAADVGEPVPELASSGATTGGVEPDSSSPPPAASPTAAVVVVHVAGQVSAPGVVTLPAGSRVQDALAAAGGALPDADLAALNLARVLTDGEQVYVPVPGESAPPPAPGAGGPTGGSTNGGGTGGLVDLNAADLAALDTLPGIGPALAQRIVDWRETNGGFRDVAELTEVSGIGPATLERLLPLVTV